MENEISKGSMLGVGLLALAAVITLGFGVFTIAKGVANNGVVNVQDSIGQIGEQEFAEYDQQIVAGSQLLAAVQKFTGKPVAILVSTKGLQDQQPIASPTDHPKAYIVTGAKIGYVNYNALLAKDSGAQLDALTSIPGATKIDTTTSSTIITLSNGSFTAPAGFVSKTDSGDTSGVVKYDNSIAGLSKSGNAEFIPTTARFEAKLIRDTSGTIMGIAFKQI